MNRKLQIELVKSEAQVWDQVNRTLADEFRLKVFKARGVPAVLVNEAHKRVNSKTNVKKA